MKDVRGNELAKGDTVMLELPKPQVIGVVVGVRGGSVLALGRGDSQRVNPGVVEVLCKFEIPVDPTNPVAGALVKLHQSPKDEAPPVSILTN